MWISFFPSHSPSPQPASISQKSVCSLALKRKEDLSQRRPVCGGQWGIWLAAAPSFGHLTAKAQKKGPDWKEVCVSISSWPAGQGLTAQPWWGCRLCWEFQHQDRQDDSTAICHLAKCSLRVYFIRNKSIYMKPFHSSPDRYPEPRLWGPNKGNSTDGRGEGWSSLGDEPSRRTVFPELKLYHLKSLCGKKG